MSDTNSRYRYFSFNDDAPFRRYIEIKQPPSGDQPVSSQTPASPAMTHGSYGALLFHPSWKLRRQQILARDGHRCVHCKSDRGLQVHHRQYHFLIAQQRFRYPWDYPDHLLITLCEPCHNRGHNKYKVPTINI